MITCKELAESIISRVKNKINNVTGKMKPLTLAIIKVGNDNASEIYVKNKCKKCNELGINTIVYSFNEETEYSQIESVIHKLNSDNDITAIIVQQPLPEHLKGLKREGHYYKDVDGLVDWNVIYLYKDEKGLIPATAKGIDKLLSSITNLDGKDVVIIGRSKLVGLPLFHLLNRRNATVTLCHSHTKDLWEKTKKADIVVAAVGKPKFLKAEHIKEKAIVIDVGINREDGKIVGDCDYENMKDKALYITPVPGGVGLLTVACLMDNIVTAAELGRKFK